MALLSDRIFKVHAGWIALDVTDARLRGVARDRYGGIREELAAGIKKKAPRTRRGSGWPRLGRDALRAAAQSMAALADASYQTYCHASASTIAAATTNKPN